MRLLKFTSGLLLILFFLGFSSCCKQNGTSSLDAETLKWVGGYTGAGTETIFKSALNEYDTLIVSVRDTVRSTGSSDCSFANPAKAVRWKSKHSDLALTCIISINWIEFSGIGAFNGTQYIQLANPNFSGIMTQNFSYAGQVNKAVLLTCQAQCSDPHFSKINYVQGFGFTEFADLIGKVWELQ